MPPPGDGFGAEAPAPSARRPGPAPSSRGAQEPARERVELPRMEPPERPAVLIAPNSFKGTLRCDQAAAWMAEGARSALSAPPGGQAVEVLVHPVADGGEGTAAAIAAALRGAAPVEAEATDPLGRPVRVAWLRVDDRTAVVEVAAAGGLALLAPAERDPMRASSRGTGELIRAAVEAGCRRVLIGLGGSATVDGGIGMAAALGIRVLDERGDPVPPGGEGLLRAARIDVSQAHPALRGVEFVALADVTNPLCGPEGAAAVFGPQKGATPGMVRALDAGLERLARCIERDLGRNVRDLPGAGAAGGIGAAVVGFLGGRLVRGAEAVLDLTGFDEACRRAFLVVTGEGRLDGQSGYGKAPVEVARRARRWGVPTVAVAGALGPGWERVLPDPIAAVFPIWPGPVPEAEAARDAGPRLAAATAHALRLVLAGRALRREP